MNPNIPIVASKSILAKLRRLWPHITPRRRAQFVLLFFLMIIVSFAEVLSIGAMLPFLAALTAPERVFSYPIIQPIIHFLGLTEPKQLLLPFASAFAIGALFSGAMRLILLWTQTRFSHAIGADFSSSIYRRTLYQPYLVHVARNSSEVIAGISIKASDVVWTTVIPLLTLLSSSLILVGILVALMAIDPVAPFVVVAGFGLIYAALVLLTKKLLVRNSQQLSHKKIHVLKALQEGLGGIRDVLLDGTQNAYCKVYQKYDLPLRRAMANIEIISSSPRFIIESLSMVFIAVLAYSMAVGSTDMTNIIAVLGALALGAQRLLPAMQQAYSSWTFMRGNQACLDDVLSLLEQKLPAYADELIPAPIPFLDRITLFNLGFKYTPQTPWILKSLDLSIAKGSRIGFIGTTGSGKSTLLDIIMGLLRPTNGGLAIDGESITEENYRAWQAHIAHVPQSIFLADTSISENIAFGIPVDQIDYERVREAARKAQIDQTIESWDNKYETLVGERGVRLSGGQRQRIGIARALYKRADVIVFDEATSALDSDTEHAVMNVIENLGHDFTILIVAHRLTTLKNCNLIVELSNGCISRSGTYSEIVGQLT